MEHTTQQRWQKLRKTTNPTCKEFTTRPTKNESYRFFTDIPIGTKEYQSYDENITENDYGEPVFVDTSPVIHKNPHCIPSEELRSQDLSNLFVPSINYADDSLQTVRHHYEDDGIAEKDVPFVSEKYLRIMTSRLRKQEKNQWFDENGDIIREDSPLTRQLVARWESDETSLPQTNYVRPTLKENLEEFAQRTSTQKDDKQKILAIHIGNLNYKNHPLFSKEQKLIFKLKQLYNIYDRRMSLQIIKIKRDKLKILREKLLQLTRRPKLSVSNELSYVQKEINTQNKIQLYQKEIKSCRESLTMECEKDRELLQSLLEIWTEIKDIREEEGFISSKWSLKVYKYDRHIKEDKQVWNKELLEYTNEIYREKMYEREKEMKKYRDNLDKWKNKKQASSESHEKPDVPADINKSEIKRQVEEVFSRIKRPPGEPEIVLELLDTETITADASCPPTERKRRALVEKTAISIKIIINNKTVMETTSQTLNNDFLVDFSCPFMVCLLSWPREIQCELIEKRKMSAKLISKASWKIPRNLKENRVIFHNLEFNPMKNSSESFRSPSGDSSEKGRTRSELSLKFSKRLLIGSTDVEPEAIIYPEDKDGSWWSFAEGIVDPNDPRNETPVHSSNDIVEKRDPSKYFRLNGSGIEFVSSSDENRLKLLRLRADQDPDFRHLKMIPSLENEILKSTIENLNSGIDQTPVDVNSDYQENIIFNPRKTLAAKVSRTFLRKLEKEAAKMKPVLKTQDVVREEQIPAIGSIGDMMSFWKPYRPLRPERKKRIQIRGAPMTKQNAKILVYVARAMQVPTREKLAEESPMTDSVRPYIEVSFQNSTIRTSTARGRNPTWNEQLSMPFSPPNEDFSVGNLQSMQDIIYFHMYDEFHVDVLEDERHKDSQIHYYVEQRWLGTLKIPFASLHRNAKIEGTFKLQMPFLFLGYTGNDDDENGTGTRLSVYLTIEPPLPPPESVELCFENIEERETSSTTKEWVNGLKLKFPQRYFLTHAVDLTVSLVSISRFIRPIPPPRGVVSDGEKRIQVENILWYVSLTASLANVKQIPGHIILANCQEFLELGIGNHEERAILLNNILLAEGYTSYLVLGSGIPQGTTFYVLTKINRKWNLLCPSSAGIFSIDDPFSPIREIFMLFSQKTMYANIQKFCDPSRMVFDVNNSSCWRSCLCKNLSDSSMTTVQPPVLNVNEEDYEGNDQLEKRLVVLLRDAIAKWRPMHRTRWNRHLSSILRKFLPQFEEAKLHGEKYEPDISKLDSVMNSHKVCGVCLHQSYSNVTSIVEATHSTNIHRCTIPGVEFALAIFVASYPANVSSVWIYVATMVKR